MPQVSVLMPAYNAAEYIRTSVQSIIDQTFTDWELIIVDDGSTDDTLDVIIGLEQTDERIKVFQNKNNLGIAKTRNRLIELAQADFIAWQDADDISDPRRLARQLQLMQENPQVGICGGYLAFFDGQKVFSKREYKTIDKDLRKNIFRFSPVAQPVAMIRKVAFEKVGNYEEDIDVAEDLLMSFKIGEQYKFANVPETLLKYRQHSKSITFKKLKTLELNTLKVRMQFRKSDKYKFGITDAIYNLAQFLTLYLLPANFRVWLFNLVRNSK